MRYLLTIGLLFLIYLIGCGGGNDGGTNNPATATGSISGYLSAPSIDQTDMQVTSRQPNSAQQPIANATVTLTDLHQSMKTDPSGFFSFFSVPVGTHQLKISHPQFRDALTMPVTVTANGVTQVETQLGVGYYISIGAGDYLYLPDSADLPNTPINAQRIATSIFHSFYGQGTLLTNTDATK